MQEEKILRIRYEPLPFQYTAEFTQVLDPDSGIKEWKLKVAQIHQKNMKEYGYFPDIASARDKALMIAQYHH